MQLQYPVEYNCNYTNFEGNYISVNSCAEDYLFSIVFLLLF